jgi:hypothetical protein
MQPDGADPAASERDGVRLAYAVPLSRLLHSL